MELELPSYWELEREETNSRRYKMDLKPLLDTPCPVRAGVTDTEDEYDQSFVIDGEPLLSRQPEWLEGQELDRLGSNQSWENL